MSNETNASMILNPSSALDQIPADIAEDPALVRWWEQLTSTERLSNECMVNTKMDSPVLRRDTIFDRNVLNPSVPLLRSSNIHGNMTFDDSADITGHLSAKIVKDNVLHTTSESEKEDCIKTKVPLELPRKKSSDNRFLRVLRKTEHGASKARMTELFAEGCAIMRGMSSPTIKERFRKEVREDSEDSMSNTVPLSPKASRAQLLRNLPKETKRVVSMLDIPEHDVEVLSKLEQSRIESKKMAEKYYEFRGSPKKFVHTSSLTAQYPRTTRDPISNNVTFDNFWPMNGARSKYLAMQSRVSRHMREDEGINTFEGAFDNVTDLSINRNLSQKIDTHHVESRIPRIPSPEISASGSKSDVADQTNITTSPRSKFHKAIKRSSKETQDRMKQDMLSWDARNFHERSTIFKPKKFMLKRAFDSSSVENPFEGAFQEHSNSRRSDNSTSIRNHTSPELDVVTLETTSHAEYSNPMANSPLDMSKKSKTWSSSYIHRRRSSSTDSEPDERMSKEQHGHLEKQHAEVPNAADMLKSVLRESKTTILPENLEISEDNVSASKTPVVSRVDADELEPLEAVTDDPPDDTTTKPPDCSTSFKRRPGRPSLVEKDLKKARLIRIDSGSKSATPKIMSDDDPPDNTTKPSDCSTSFKRRPGRPSLVEKNLKKAHLIPSDSGSKSATPNMSVVQIMSDVLVKLPRRSSRLNSSIEHSDNLSLEPEVERSARGKRSSTRNSKNISVSKRASAVIDKSTELEETVATDKVRNATVESQTSPQNSSSLRERKDDKKITRRTSERLSGAQDSGKSNVKENKNPSLRQSTSTKSQGQRSSPVKAPNKNSISKTNTSNKKIEDFFKMKPSSSQEVFHSLPSDIFKDAKKLQQIKERVETMKSREIAAMKMHAEKKTIKKESVSNVKASRGTVKNKKPPAAAVEKVDPAYLVNGKVYKAPKLLRPKHWATNRLYKFLWKRMEPKYNLSMRLRSEQFIQELNKIVTLISRRKKYSSYKNELEALMKEMARLEIIKTRNDFYDFCRDFMPPEFRVKVIPILLPGNQQTIPYDPEKLYTPLLDE